MAMTKLENVIKKDVLADYIDAKLTDKIVLSPLMVIDRTLENASGDTVSFPQFAYIGDATEMVEGTELETSILSATETKVTVKQIGKAVEVSDRAMLSAHGDIIGESVDQIILAIANKIEKDAFAELDKATLTYEMKAGHELFSNDLAAAQTLFGEDIDDEMFAFVNPKNYMKFRVDPTFISSMISFSPDNIVIGGTVGEVYGCKIVVSNRVPEDTAYIVKKDALGLVLKRSCDVEEDRDVRKKSTIIAADQHYAVYLRNQAKVIKMVKTEE